VTATLISNFWHDQLVEHGRQGLFLVLVGFVGSFGFIRMSTRLMRSPRVPWWPGSIVSDSGVHLHHLVFGICTMMAAGTLGFWFFDTSPWLEICALFFGIGAGLTIDEFALFVHLDDVYWSREGRSSIDATVIAAAGMGLILLGVRPFDVLSNGDADVIETVIGAIIVLCVSTICFAKGRLMHGTIGFLIFPIGLYGAARIGKPGSLWANRFYGERKPRKQAKAEQRFRDDRRTERLKESVRDAVGGSTKEVYEARLSERASTEEAAAEIRRRAEQLTAAESEEPKAPH
jgi:hypothetical protein